MKKTITIKGLGFMSVKPDLIDLSINLRSLDKDYEKAYGLAKEKNQILLDLVEKLGFEKADLKTSYFNIDKEYRSERDEYNNYKQVFVGYKVYQDLKLSFDLDTDRLSKVFSEISKSQIEAELSIRFTIKNPTQVNYELLKLAAKDAKKKAEILCQSLGKKLGDVITINYDWKEIDIYSHSNHMPRIMDNALLDESSAYEMEAEEITLTDNATFIWNIE